MRRLSALFIFAISGCTTVVVPDPESVFQGDFKGNYIVLADCSFSRLQHEMGQLTQARLDSVKSIQISRGEYGGIYWTLELKENGSQATSVVFRSVRAVWGKDFYANQVLPSVRACSAS